MAQDEPRLDEIRALLRELPGPDEAAAAAAQARQSALALPSGGLGRLGELALWLAAWQNAGPRLERPRVALFAANHGIAERADADMNETARQVQAAVGGRAAINQVAGAWDSDLRVYEMALEQPSADFTAGPALSEADCARALSYGMMAVEQGFDVMGLGAIAQGGDLSAAALCLALFGGEASDWLPEGAPSEAAAWLAAALEANRAALGDPLEVLRCFGGLETAAVVGAILACRLARTPVLLDGVPALAAAAVLHAREPALLDHCQVAQLGNDPAAERLARRLNRRPLLDLGLTDGDGFGAALAIPLLQAAVACHTGMASREG
ncbi:nicotinate-nucleotide--dimethylbenzimidazole phosphoribosyltransferase [Aquibaculum arenosum]|uniref:Nicotinate-nucleotide--dimethylbenzimidazole phosphoribosyltransferase n=1 Tax=Aquibaculum arenosum TaxID=3032591 RepID=A0ABT5YIZ0_9PROT|nr:nicotinate-nucleotide--dimethylbenzimidazole phosphoribosyltransferase [Fodinicurvata sp. CAU 1616]MDF2094911.1 nicotinate-nucleotide--dimethylbenzimidazole phosphoribosyltransferase [Fodinicurvata sp. CAU 1616]